MFFYSSTGARQFNTVVQDSLEPIRDSMVSSAVEGGMMTAAMRDSSTVIWESVTMRCAALKGFCPNSPPVQYGERLNIKYVSSSQWWA